MTARVVWADHTAKVSGKWAGDWAVGVVQEHSWGLPSWDRRVVLLTNHMFRDGETIFVSGSREIGVLTRLLPIVNARPCGTFYTQPAADARIQLELLRKPPAVGESRIMGYVRSPVPLAPISRAGTTRTLTTDRDGMYVLAGRSWLDRIFTRTGGSLKVGQHMGRREAVVSPPIGIERCSTGSRVSTAKLRWAGAAQLSLPQYVRVGSACTVASRSPRTSSYHAARGRPGLSWPHPQRRHRHCRACIPLRRN